MTKEKAQKIFQLLKKHYPHAKMILEWTNNFELLVSIILSAQCTDKKVNEVTSVVFPKYKKERSEFSSQYNKFSRIALSKKQIKQGKDPHVVPLSGTPQDDKLEETMIIQLVNFANTPLTELEQDIKSTGFYHNKAKSVQAAANTVLEKFNGVLPKTIAALTSIPGVGRKTANVFLTNAYNINEGIAVDTHVIKQSQALGLTKNTTPEKIEKDLMHLFPQNEWHDLTYMLIEHGRNIRKKASDRVVCSNPTCLLCSAGK